MNIGLRIKKARKLLNLTQAELGHKANQSTERVRSYESGARTPNEKYLSEIATGIGFPLEFFSDHKIDSMTEIFQMLYELEESIGLTVTPTEYGTYALTTKDITFNLYLERWYAKKMELKNGKCTKEEYDLWCARFPQSISEDLHERMIMQMEKDKKTEE